MQQEDIALVNIYEPNIRASKYIKRIVMDLKKKFDSNIVIAIDFNTPLTSMDSSFRQKINKETMASNDT